VGRVAWSDDVRLAVDPKRSYQRYVERDAPTTWLMALQRPALVLLVIATVVPIAATGRVTLGLVFTVALSWSFVVVLQALAAFALIASAPARRTSAPRAIELFFAGHVPWSVWLTVTAAVAASDLDLIPPVAVVVSILLPAICTARIVFHFNRVVLATTSRGAWLRAVGHQVFIWSVGLSFVAWSAGGWFRLLG
jgi:hypothetical protein